VNEIQKKIGRIEAKQRACHKTQIYVHGKQMDGDCPEIFIWCSKIGPYTWHAVFVTRKPCYRRENSAMPL